MIGAVLLLRGLSSQPPSDDPPQSDIVTETEAVSETETETELQTESDTDAPAITYPTVIDEYGKDTLTGIAPAAKGTHIDPLTGTAVSKEEAERIAQEIKDGLDFKEAAKKYSSETIKLLTRQAGFCSKFSPNTSSILFVKMNSYL